MPKVNDKTAILWNAVPAIAFGCTHDVIPDKKCYHVLYKIKYDPVVVLINTTMRLTLCFSLSHIQEKQTSFVLFCRTTLFLLPF